MSDLRIDTKALLALEPNWDSYGAPRLNPKCVKRAQEVAAVLRGDWVAVPGSDGGVQLEWNEDGMVFEFSISPAPTGETGNE